MNLIGICKSGGNTCLRLYSLESKRCYRLAIYVNHPPRVGQLTRISNDRRPSFPGYDYIYTSVIAKLLPLDVTFKNKYYSK